MHTASAQYWSESDAIFLAMNEKRAFHGKTKEVEPKVTAFIKWKLELKAELRKFSKHAAAA